MRVLRVRLRARVLGAAVGEMRAWWRGGSPRVGSVLAVGAAGARPKSAEDVLAVGVAGAPRTCSRWASQEAVSCGRVIARWGVLWAWPISWWGVLWPISR
ncbi:hypothetical protein [Nonomuraea sp. CA-141351]|uniref:hypothetical protein n=1 Tax=Nonomuraea sp. CA-141351 TaxID=3239996 RepID=UPI003D8F0982